MVRKSKLAAEHIIYVVWECPQCIRLDKTWAGISTVNEYSVCTLYWAAVYIVTNLYIAQDIRDYETII